MKISSSERSGSPVIADLNGDGEADIGVASDRNYSAFRSDGSLLWSIRINDRSSAVTSSSVFDFENDGKAEVVYADEQFFRIIDGTTGKIKYLRQNTSITLQELPVITDGDGDGHADIFLISNWSWNVSPYHGLRMLSGKNKNCRYTV